MTDDGALQRGSLQGLFSRNAAANRTLIDILKPHVLAVMHRWTEQQNATYVIWESALLLWEQIAVDQMLVVEAQTPIRLQRIRHRNPKWSEGDMLNLLRVQANLQRTPVEDTSIIRNDDSMEALREQVEKLHRHYQTIWN